MIERVVYTPAAEQDVADAYNWYEARQPGLGEDFLRCVEACVLSIQRQPQQYPVAVDEFRQALVRPLQVEDNPRSGTWGAATVPRLCIGTMGQHGSELAR